MGLRSSELQMHAFYPNAPCWIRFADGSMLCYLIHAHNSQLVQLTRIAKACTARGPP